MDLGLRRKVAVVTGLDELVAGGSVETVD